MIMARQPSGWRSWRRHLSTPCDAAYCTPPVMTAYKARDVMTIAKSLSLSLPIPTSRHLGGKKPVRFWYARSYKQTKPRKAGKFPKVRECIISVSHFERGSAAPSSLALLEREHRCTSLFARSIPTPRGIEGNCCRGAESKNMARILRQLTGQGG